MKENNKMYDEEVLIEEDARPDNVKEGEDDFYVPKA